MQEKSGEFRQQTSFNTEKKTLMQKQETAHPSGVKEINKFIGIFLRDSPTFVIRTQKRLFLGRYCRKPSIFKG